MINYLKGQVISVGKNFQNRTMLILDVNQVGYEIQIPNSLTQQFTPDETEIVQVFTHLQIREDQHLLFGFISPAQRDLFAQLISVSGIGAQLAIALIDTLGLEGLVQAIVTGNLEQLSKTPGVGKKTAERIALELKTKLSQWRQVSGLSTTDHPAPDASILADVEMTLLALGYTQAEINRAIAALSQDVSLQKNRNVEDWIRQAITWLSL
ncbi:MAG: Holliday junction branch migration protein RuvA [Snowella sp.]|nr:Holliday junction branch migration protein RuvA [Snowella sp.]